MPLTRVDLQIENTINDECTSFSLADTTGEYPASADGYGAPDVIIHDDVTGLVIIVRNLSTGTYFTYTFTVLLQVTQTCLLSIDGGTGTDIQTEVGPLAFPFITDVNEFDLWADYGVTLPDFGDAVYQVEYTISGNSTEGGAPEDFSYTTSETFLVDCEISCCISKMYANLDPDCSCSDSSQAKADTAYAFLKAAHYASEIGQTEKSVADLIKAQDLCDCDCGCN